jgi:hypothetical protein
MGPVPARSENFASCVRGAAAAGVDFDRASPEEQEAHARAMAVTGGGLIVWRVLPTVQAAAPALQVTEHHVALQSVDQR